MTWRVLMCRLFHHKVSIANGEVRCAWCGRLVDVLPDQLSEGV